MSGCVLWLSGLPCSGKTTISKAVMSKLPESVKVEHLDGDALRKIICSDLGFSKEDRAENLKRVSMLAAYLSQDRIVLCSFVSPYKKDRDLIRQKVCSFIEVFVDCPVEECIKRDVKGMYKKALAGEITNFTGVGAPYEKPESPEIICHTNKETVDESANRIISYLSVEGFL